MHIPSSTSSPLVLQPQLQPLQYAKPVTQIADGRLTLYNAESLKGLQPYKTQFLHWENAQGLVGVLPIVEKKDGSKCVELMCIKRPALGGRISLELAGGAIGDSKADECIKEAAVRELQEEAGLKARFIQPLSPTFVRQAPSWATERLMLTLAVAKESERIPQQLSENEKATYAGQLQVPLETFLSDQKFQQWMQGLSEQGFELSAAVLSARGLLPQRLGNGLRLDRKA